MKTKTQRKPKTHAQITREFEDRRIAEGSVRMPGGLLPADAAMALSELVASGYAPSKVAAIAQALRDVYSVVRAKNKTI